MKTIAFAFFFSALTLWGNAHLSHRGAPLSAPPADQRDTLIAEQDTTAQREDLSVQSWLESNITPMNQKTAFQLEGMPYFYGAYEMEMVKNGITSCHYNLFLGQRIYTIFPIDEAIEHVEREKQGLPAITAERATMKSIDPNVLFDLLFQGNGIYNWNITSELIDDGIIDFLRNDYFSQLYRLDTLFALPPELRPDLSTLGMDSPERQLPELYGTNLMHYLFENGQEAVQTMEWKGREYDQFSTIPLEEFGSPYLYNAHLQPYRYTMGAEVKGELRVTHKMGFEAFYDALTITYRNLYLGRRWRETMRNVPEGYFKTLRAEVEATIDSVAKHHKATAQRGGKTTATSITPLGTATDAPDTPARHVRGELEMKQFLSRHVQYPKSSIEKGVQGAVVVRFRVNPDGTFTGVHVVRSLDEYCDLEAINAVWCLPYMVPAFKDGRPVSSWMEVPVKFSIAK